MKSPIDIIVEVRKEVPKLLLRGGLVDEKLIKEATKYVMNVSRKHVRKEESSVLMFSLNKGQSGYYPFCVGWFNTDVRPIVSDLEILYKIKDKISSKILDCNPVIVRETPYYPLLIPKSADNLGIVFFSRKIEEREKYAILLKHFHPETQEPFDESDYKTFIHFRELMQKLFNRVDYDILSDFSLKYSLMSTNDLVPAVILSGRYSFTRGIVKIVTRNKIYTLSESSSEFSSLLYRRFHEIKTEKDLDNFLKAMVILGETKMSSKRYNNNQ